MRRQTKISIKNINSTFSQDMLPQVFSNYTVKDLVNLKEINIDLYKYLCSQVHIYLNPDKLWKFTLELIKMDQLNRLLEEVKIIMKVTENLNFFQKLNEKPKNIENQLHQKVCNQIFGEFYHQGSIIFRQNDAPTKFYIIMKGAVNIFLEKSQEEIVQALQEKAQSANFIKRYFQKLKDSSNSTSSIDEKNHQDFINSIEETQQLILEQTGDIPARSLKNIDFFYEEGVIKHRYILTLKEGNMFGELGILMEKPRSASVIAQQDTELAVLDSNYYRQILKDVELKKIDARIAFFVKNFFHNMSYQMALKYCYNFEKKKFKQRDLIYQEGSQTQFVYIVKQGDIKFTKKIDVNQLQSDEIYQQHSLMNIKNWVQFELYSISEGQVFGEIEIIEGTPRSCTAQCVSAEAKVYQLSKEIFQRILKDSQNIRKTIKSNIYQKKKWMSERQIFLKEQKELVIQSQKSSDKKEKKKNEISLKFLSKANLNTTTWISMIKIKNNLSKQFKEKSVEQNGDYFNPLNITSAQTERKIRLKLNSLQLSTDKFNAMINNAKFNKKKSSLQSNHLISQNESPEKKDPIQFIKRINSQISNETFQKLKRKSNSLEIRRTDASTQNTIDDTFLDSHGKNIMNINLIKVPFFEQNNIAETTISTLKYSTERSLKKNLEKVLINSRHNQFRLKPEKSHLIQSRYKKMPSI